MKSILYAICAILIFTAVADAQSAKMSSVYTDMANECRAEKKSVDEEVPFICKAVGQYRARVTPAGAYEETLEIVDFSGETAVTIGNFPYGTSTRKGRMLEWRMANGQPFAVIFRSSVFDTERAERDGENPNLAKYKIGERLLVIGLPGHGQIDFEVDAAKKNANAEAQRLADSNFQ